MARVTKKHLQDEIVELQNKLEDCYLLIGKKEFDLQRAQAINSQLMRALREREGGNVGAT